MAGTARGCQLVVASTKDSSTTVVRVELSAESSSNARNKLSDAVGYLAKKINVVAEQNFATIEGGYVLYCTVLLSAAVPYRSQQNKMLYCSGGITSVVTKIDVPEEKRAVLECLESFSAELSKLEEFRRDVEGRDALFSVEQKNQSKFYLPSEVGKVGIFMSILSV